MKKSVVLLFAFVLSLSLFGQKTYDLDKFNAVANSSFADVNIRIGSTQKVTARGSSSAIDKLMLEVDNGSLEIKSRKGGSWSNDGNVTINITMTRLTALACSGSGDVQLEGNFDMESFAVANSGSGDLTATGNLNVQKLTIANSGSGDLEMAGSADKLTISNSGSGDAGLARVSAKTVTVSNNGSGDCEVRCSGNLNAVNTGSGDITVSGKPAKKSIVNTGSGDISYERQEE